MKKKCLEVCMILTLFVAANTALAQSRERSTVPVECTWKLEDLYPSTEAWNAAKTNVVAEFSKISGFKDKLATSPDELYGCLKLRSDCGKELSRLYSYASMLSDQDTRESKSLSMKQEMDQTYVDLMARASFIEAEIAAMSKEEIEQFIARDPRLTVYRLYLMDIQRRKAHKLSEKEEKLIAQARMMADAPQTIYGIFSNAELPYPEVKLTDGTTVLLDQAGYGRLRASANRADREIVFNTFFTTLQKFRRTFGTQLYANLKTDLFFARARNYENCLASALDENNIPPEVYYSLVKNINDNLPTFHRYLKLRQRMLGVDHLQYYDLYAPTVKGVSLEYQLEEGKRLILDALQPLGQQYVDGISAAYANRWIDFYPTTGKRSGAYSNGSAYDVHPYILMNYNGQYNEVSTLAHELGHTMHSYFSNRTQPYPLADYPIFVAEVASTMNEALLIDYMLKHIKNDDVRLSLLMSHLDNIKGTLFRQTQFAEFELRIHEAVERGEALTGDDFSRIYGEIFKKYYGDDQGICKVDDLYAMEWAYIPHFYYNYYVYQYATSFTASTALSEKILAREKGAVDKYLAFISSGGSAYPIDLLKTAGVDMTTAEPFQKAMAAMNRTMDEIEKILNKRR